LGGGHYELLRGDELLDQLEDLLERRMVNA